MKRKNMSFIGSTVVQTYQKSAMKAISQHLKISQLLESIA